MNPLDYCQNEHAPRGSALYYSLHFLTPQYKAALLPIFAFAKTIQNIPSKKEPEIANTQLNWWLGEIQNIDNPTHPITQALKPIIQKYELPLELFQEHVQGILQTMHYQAYHHFSDLVQHAHRLTYAPSQLNAKILGVENKETATFLHQCGLALTLCELIGSLRNDALLGNVFFPSEDLSRFNLTATSILDEQNQESLKNLLAFEAKRARDVYQAALLELPKQSRYPLHPYLIQAAIAFKLVDEIERDGFQVFKHQIALKPITKAWIAWKTHRHEKRTIKEKR